jgi:hypothetical protein
VAWDAAASHWTVACLSKNGMSVNAQPLRPEDDPLLLRDGMLNLVGAQRLECC